MRKKTDSRARHWRSVVGMLMASGAGIGGVVALPTPALADSTGFPTVASVSVPNAVAVAVDPFAERLYVVVSFAPATSRPELEVLDENTLKPITQLDLAPNPTTVAVDPVHNRAYIGYGDSSSTNVSVIDTATDMVLGGIGTGAGPGGIGIDTATDRVYVANYFSSTLSVIDGSTDQVIDTVPTDAYPYSVEVNDTSGQVFVGENSGSLLVLDASTHARLADVSTAYQHDGGSGAIAVDPSNDHVFVPNNVNIPQAELVTVDGAGYQVTADTATNSYPVAAAYDPSHDWVYVAAIDSPTLSVVDASNAQAVGSQPVPAAMALADDPGLGRLFVLSRPYNRATSSYTWTLYSYDTTGAGGTGPAPPPAPTTTSLAASPNPSSVGQSVTVTATVTPSDAGGTVQFLLDNGNSIPGCDAVNLTAAGSGATASCTVNGLNAGTHRVQAIYSADNAYMASSSAPLAVTVNPVQTTTTVSASPNPSYFGQNVTATATVSPSDAGGSVQFLLDDGNSIPGCDAVSLTATESGAAASCIINGLSLGAHQVYAIYSGDAIYGASSSPSLTLDVGRVPTDLTANPAIVSTAMPRLTAFTLSARLTDPLGAPISGKTVVMTAGSTLLCQATSDANGLASCSAGSNSPSVIANDGYQAMFSGDSIYLSSAANAGLIGP